MEKIIFSLPIHERLDILINQLENINKFVPNNLVCVHISQGSEIELDEALEASKNFNVIINKERKDTGPHKGLMEAHISNFNLVSNKDFEYFAFLSSNELFIKSGLYNHMKNFDVGVQLESIKRCPDWHVFKRPIQYNDNLLNLLNYLNQNKKFGNIDGHNISPKNIDSNSLIRLSRIYSTEIKSFLLTKSELKKPTFVYGGQAEGQFFRRKIFEEIASLYQQFFGKGCQSFETEEIIPSTICATLIEDLKITKPFTLQNYSHKFVINKELIEKILDDKFTLLAPKIDGNLWSAHYGSGNCSTIFSLKRINREFTESRNYISSLKATCLSKL